MLRHCNIFGRHSPLKLKSYRLSSIFSIFHLISLFRSRHGMTLTFRICTCVNDLIYWSQKSVIYQIFVLKVKLRKLNFSMEKSKFAPSMLLYRFFLLLVLVSICAKYLENFPEIHLNFLEILVCEILVTGKCCKWFLKGKCAAREGFSFMIFSSSVCAVFCDMRLRHVIIMKRAYLSFTGISLKPGPISTTLHG